MKPSVLVLNNWSIYPPQSGGQQAIYQLSAGLTPEHQCTYAFLSDYSDAEVRLPLGERFDSIELPGRRHKTLGSRLRAPGFLYSERLTRFALRAYASAPLRKSLTRLIEAHDAVIFSHPWAWMAAKDIPALRHKLVIYDSHNVEADLARQSTAPPLKKYFNSRAVRKIERELCEYADLILTCTQEDCNSYVQQFGIDPQKIETGFKGVQCALHADTALRGFHDRKPIALFVGSDWIPNNNAANLIAHQLAPSVPSVEWLIAGTCSKQVTTPTSSNVRLLGFVDDLPELMGQALVAVNPIHEGSGINMKMMEYLAAGLPVVTTSFGARGITGRARDALLVRDIADFPEAIAQVLQSPEHWLSLSRQARDSAVDQFDWSAITRRLSDLIVQKMSMPDAGNRDAATGRQLAQPSNTNLIKEGS